MPSFGKASSNEYYTPPSALKILLPYLPKHWTIWECAWGKGHLADALKANGYEVVGGPEINFYQRINFEWDAIVTNPPFEDKDGFLDHAFYRGKPFAFLLPLDSLSGVKRHRLLSKHGIQLVIPSKLILFIGGRTLHPAMRTAWWCWGFSLPKDINFVAAQW